MNYQLNGNGLGSWYNLSANNLCYRQLEIKKTLRKTTLLPREKKKTTYIEYWFYIRHSKKGNKDRISRSTPPLDNIMFLLLFVFLLPKFYK